MSAAPWAAELEEMFADLPTLEESFGAAEDFFEAHMFDDVPEPHALLVVGAAVSGSDEERSGPRWMDEAAQGDAAARP